MSLSEPASSRREMAGSLTLSLVWVFVTVVGLVLKPDGHGHGTHQRLGRHLARACCCSIGHARDVD